MRKFVILVMMLCSSLLTLEANSYQRTNTVAEQAFKDLDCAFGGCKKEEPKPKVIVKEKIVEKPVIKEKIVYKNHTVYKDRVVYKERPQEVDTKQKVVTEQKVAESQASKTLKYNKAFFDIYPKSQAPILDYINYSSRSSFDVNQFVDSVQKIKESGIKAYVYGRLAVPKSITTNEVYMFSGGNYNYNQSWWKKLIYYNDSKIAQNADYFLVKVQTDANQRRFVKYKIYFLFDYPWKVTPSSTNSIPSNFFFKMAPKVRGFKNKFIKCTPYIIEE